MIGPGAKPLTPAELDAALGYIASHPEIWEVILTGGDPLVLSARRLKQVVSRLATDPSRQNHPHPHPRAGRRTGSDHA